jgi:hypothetical protein
VIARLATLGCLLVVLAGCGETYTLRGRVVSGMSPYVSFVPADDATLTSNAGVAHASISVYRDPDKPNRALAAKGRSDARGNITIPIKSFGVGWMAEQWLIQVVSPGFETHEELITMPSAKDELKTLIVLTRGYSVAPKPEEDLIDEYERFR